MKRFNIKHEDKIEKYLDEIQENDKDKNLTYEEIIRFYDKVKCYLASKRIPSDYWQYTKAEYHQPVTAHDRKRKTRRFTIATIEFGAVEDFVWIERKPLPKKYRSSPNISLELSERAIEYICATVPTEIEREFSK